jgi:hypothetical protein
MLAKIELARNYKLSRLQLKDIKRIIEKHYDELVTAWRAYFGN